MQAVKRLVMLTVMLAVIAGMAIAQSPTNGWPNDPQGYNYKPWDQATQFVCYYYLYKGVYYPVPGVTVSWKTYTKMGSGWHGHDTGVGRPQALILSTPGSTVTGPNGCNTTSSVLEFPGIAGWYTIEATSGTTVQNNQIIPPMTKGINYYAKYTSPSEGALAPYPDDPTVNVPLALDGDPGHSDQNHWATVGTIADVRLGSQTYIAVGKALGVIDRAEITRCSLPDGGLADNQIQWTPAYLWETQAYEEHDQGTECDVSNPVIDVNHTAGLIKAFQQSGCVVGSYSPVDPGSGSTPPLSNPVMFWLKQAAIHFACRSSAYKLPPGNPLY